MTNYREILRLHNLGLNKTDANTASTRPSTRTKPATSTDEIGR